ncbi:MAG: hypothetical protein KDH88_02995 [Chromatiales bacterium]|nr:hypothetical protein [Chromatiales bacterium]
MDSGGFIDLRMDRANEGVEDSFWPSFADILSVIVMIFMLAMVILLLRNLELVEQLRATMAAEREAAAMAQNTSRQKDEIATALSETETELSMLRLQLMRMDEIKDDLQQRLAERDRLLSLAEDERQRLESGNAALSDRVVNLERDADSLNRELRSRIAATTALTENNQRLQQDFRDASLSRDEAEKALRELRLLHARISRELSQSKELTTLAQQDLDREKGRYSELKVKYDKLVRPARTSRGKYVADVVFSKVDGKERIELRRPGDDTPHVLSASEMDRELDALKNKYGKELYVKVIIPKDSGLSYNEAWSFTTRVLTQYDYYYQENAENNPTDAP